MYCTKMSGDKRHLLATICKLTTNDIILPYKIVYLDSKTVTATMHG